MRRITIGLLLFTLIIVPLAAPAIAGKQGVPGRRVGGGTRLTAPRLKQPTPAASISGNLPFTVSNHRPELLTLTMIKL